MAGTARKVIAATAVAAGGAALAAWALSPRRDEVVKARWRQVARHRYAHRGLHDAAAGIPENSLAAFRRARELGFGAELDVHLAADGGLVVIHDSDLSRMCGCAGVVEDMSSEALARLRLAGTEERIPTLDEVLEVFEWDAAAGDDMPAPLVVELKTRGGNAFELAERAMAALDRRCVRYVVESFDPRVALWLRARRPDVIRGQLSENFLRDGATSDQPLVVRAAAGALLGNLAGRPDFVSYRFADRRDPAPALACGPLRNRLVTWTIRNQRDLLATEAEGAPAIFEGFVPGPRSTID